MDTLYSQSLPPLRGDSAEILCPANRRVPEMRKLCLNIKFIFSNFSLVAQRKVTKESAPRTPTESLSFAHLPSPLCRTTFSSHRSWTALAPSYSDLTGLGSVINFCTRRVPDMGRFCFYNNKQHQVFLRTLA